MKLWVETVSYAILDFRFFDFASEQVLDFRFGNDLFSKGLELTYSCILFLNWYPQSAIELTAVTPDISQLPTVDPTKNGYCATYTRLVEKSKF